ncbi:spore germination protein [Ureibacillus sp. 179-F W5.1 NHS]|uniref:spore germination protein n=1 Tax=Ureibacillus sp. 179-F W5.1 NHS TaxID=3374297 RepID=UPI003879B9B9
MDTSGHSSFKHFELKQLFEKSEDIIFNEMTFQQSKVLLIKCDSMVDEQLLYTLVLPNIEKLYKNSTNQITEEQIKQLPIPNLKKLTDKKDVITSAFSGNLLIFFEDNELLYSCNIARKPNRSIEETNMEVMVKGARDNFIEDLATNIALIRKRLPTNSLCVEKIEIGRRSKTKIALLYFDDIANKDILTELKTRFLEIDTDIIISGDSLMEFVDKKNWIFPTSNYTGTAEFAVQSLLRGRYVILVDTVAYATITPVNFFYLLKAGEDFEVAGIYSVFARGLRLIGTLLGVALPAFWLALTLFHQNQLPLQLLATVVMTNQGLPFPAVLEMLLILLMFEILREAGLRLPTKIGGIIGVIGGLIIGDAAIRSGITSPAMVVVIATATIASYTVVNRELESIISILRIFCILLTAFFGLFGFFISLFFLLLYTANIRVFGIPYINITADLSWDNVKQTLFRVAKYKYRKRPDFLEAQDKTRNNEGNNR